MPRGRGRRVMPYRNAARGRLRPPAEPEPRPGRRRHNRAQQEPGVEPVALDQPVQPQPPVPQVQEAPPPPVPAPVAQPIQQPVQQPEIFPAPQNVNPNGEVLLIPTKSDIDVFVSQKMSNQIWNLEYIDLAHLLYKNFVSNIDKPKKVLGFDEDGDILVERNKYSKVKSITNIDEWSEGFLNYMKILLQIFPTLANDLISYMSIISGAVPDVPFEKINKYDQQFRLRIANFF